VQNRTQSERPPQVYCTVSDAIAQQREHSTPKAVLTLFECLQLMQITGIHPDGLTSESGL